MKKIIFILLLSALILPSCVRKDAKCKSEHRKARKKGTGGWQY